MVVSVRVRSARHDRAQERLQCLRTSLHPKQTSITLRQLLRLQALQQLQRGIAVRGQADAALVTTQGLARGGPDHAVGRAAVEAAFVQRRLQRKHLAARERRSDRAATTPARRGRRPGAAQAGSLRARSWSSCCSAGSRESSGRPRRPARARPRAAGSRRRQTPAAARRRWCRTPSAAHCALGCSHFGVGAAHSRIRAATAPRPPRARRRASRSAQRKFAVEAITSAKLPQMSRRPSPSASTA